MPSSDQIVWASMPRRSRSRDLDRQRQRRMDPSAERREDHEPPVAQLVAEALDDEPPIGRQRAGDLALLVEVGDEVRGRELVEVVLLAKARRERARAALAARQLALGLAQELADRPPQLHRPPDGIALPERQLARHARRRLDDDPVRRDVEHPPARGAEDDHVAVHPGTELVDHLLVELADAPARRSRLAREEDPEQPAVRDRAAARHRDDARVPPALDDVRHAVPGEPGLELGELVGRIGAGEHPQHGLERLARQRLERRRPRDELEQLRNRPAVHDGHRHELLREDVERVSGHDRRLDRPVVHPLDDDRRLEKVAAELREDDALRWLADLVARAADALQPRGDARRRFDEHDQVDGAHVDAELERRGGHEARDPAGLEVLLDLEPLLPRDRAVVREDELLAGELVESLREPLGEPAAVREDDGRAVGPDQLEQPRVDRRPDARPHVAERDGAAGLLVGREDLAEAGHVLDRDDDLELEGLAAPGIDDLDLAPRPDPAEEAGDGLERPLRRRQPDPLERRRVRGAELLQALQRQRQVGAALRAGDRVDLVEDHRLDAAEAVSRAAEVSIRYRLSGVVTRMSGGCFASSRRCSCGVSPVRPAIVIRGSGSPSRCAASAMPCSGARRFRSTS